MYRYGYGAQTLQIVGDVEAVRLTANGIEIECPVVLDTPRADGLEPAWIAGCPERAGQLTFVSIEPKGTDFPIIVFDGNTFYRDPACSPEMADE